MLSSLTRCRPARGISPIPDKQSRNGLDNPFRRFVLGIGFRTQDSDRPPRNHCSRTIRSLALRCPRISSVGSRPAPQPSRVDTGVYRRLGALYPRQARQFTRAPRSRKQCYYVPAYPADRPLSIWQARLLSWVGVQRAGRACKSVLRCSRKLRS
jgi:hypothetical protein